MEFKTKTYVIFSIIAVGIGSFLLGGLFVYAFLYEIKDTDTMLIFEPLPVTFEMTDRVYASSRGTRYYPWWCEGGNRILEKNKVWFTSAANAKKAGYTIAKSCLKYEMLY